MSEITHFPTPTHRPRRGVDVPDLSDIPTAAWNAGGAASMLSLLFVSLVKGWLVVGNVHREQLADKDAQIGQLWGTVESLTGSVQKLTVNADVSAHAWHSIDKMARGGEGK